MLWLVWFSVPCLFFTFLSLGIRSEMKARLFSYLFAGGAAAFIIVGIWDNSPMPTWMPFVLLAAFIASVFFGVICALAIKTRRGD